MQFIKLAWIYGKNTNLAAIFEGYHSNEWHVKTIGNASSKTVHVLRKNGKESSVVILFHKRNSVEPITDKQPGGYIALKLDTQDLMIEQFLSMPSVHKIRLIALLTSMEAWETEFLSETIIENQFVSKNNCTSTYCDKVTTSFCDERSTDRRCYLVKKSIPNLYTNNSENITTFVGKQLSPSRFTQDSMQDVQTRVEQSVLKMQWGMWEKVWVSYFFRDTVLSRVANVEKILSGQITRITSSKRIYRTSRRVCSHVLPCCIFAENGKSWRKE